MPFGFVCVLVVSCVSSRFHLRGQKGARRLRLLVISRYFSAFELLEQFTLIFPPSTSRCWSVSPPPPRQAKHMVAKGAVAFGLYPQPASRTCPCFVFMRVVCFLVSVGVWLRVWGGVMLNTLPPALSGKKCGAAFLSFCSVFLYIS